MLVKFDLNSVLANSATPRLIIDNLPKYPGLSFLINYHDLKLNYKFYNKTDVVDYIIMASYRDYNYAVAYDDYTIDWDLVPLTKDKIKSNKLIWSNNGKIFFMYEESKASTLRKRNKNGN